MVKACDICGCLDFNIIFKIGTQKLVKCKKCKLVFFDKQRDDLLNLYDKDYFLKSEGGWESYLNCNETGSKNIIKTNFKFAYDFIQKNSGKKNLLDVGAGYGHFIKYLPPGIRAEAVEINPQAARTVKELGIKVYEDDFQNVKFSKKYAFITSFDVIEHQINLKKYLEKVHSLLDKNGYFILTTPDYGSIFNKILGRHATTIRPSYHNYYFEKRWIENNFPLFGFKIVRIRTSYFTKTSLKHILVLASLSFPQIKKVDFIQRTPLAKIVLPFFRLGGLQIIAQKMN